MLKLEILGAIRCHISTKAVERTDFFAHLEYFDSASLVPKSNEGGERQVDSASLTSPSLIQRIILEKNFSEPSRNRTRKPSITTPNDK